MTKYYRIVRDDWLNTYKSQVQNMKPCDLWNHSTLWGKILMLVAALSMSIFIALSVWQTLCVRPCT